MLVSWSSVIQTHMSKNQLVNMIHGALAVYDLGDLIASLPDDKVKIINHIDAAGNPIQ